MSLTTRELNTSHGSIPGLYPETLNEKPHLKTGEYLKALPVQTLVLSEPGEEAKAF